MDTGIVTISQEELDKLKENSLFLKALHDGGVKDWQEYDLIHGFYQYDKKQREKGIS